MKPGFYLVMPTGERHFIATTVSPTAFERACDRHLTSATGWQYWIDRLVGRDVRGDLHWSNLDWTDSFLDACQAQYQ
jgi:hypothetical protein